jgi:hypothetical protein
MSLFVDQITLTGGVDSLATLAAFSGAAKKGIRQLTIQGAAGNALATVGSLASVTAGEGLVIPATDILIRNLAGPFSGNASTNLDEWYIQGTNTNLFTILLVTP